MSTAIISTATSPPPETAVAEEAVITPPTPEPSWALDDYTPVVNLPLPPGNVIGNGSSVPSSCTAPSLYTVGSNAYVCKNGVFVSINGQSFNLRGAWAANTAYNPYDVVTYAGSSLVATIAFTTGATFSSCLARLPPVRPSRSPPEPASA
jgi:hypothetical protein